MKANRLIELVKKNKGKNNKYFMPFLVAGDPNLSQFKRLALAIEPFLDILEIGIPFSDPIADGPTVQEANVRAFQAGIDTESALNAIKEIRENTEKPIVILTYYNILIQGAESVKASLDKTFQRLKKSGVDGVVIGDLPIEEANLTLKMCEKYDICLIFLIAPSTTEKRMKRILEKARGFVYLISVMGVTGARDEIAEITKNTIQDVQEKIKKPLPVLVGFGISKPIHARDLINAGADGIIIGSAIIKIIENNLDDYEKMEKKMIKFTSSIKESLQ